MNQQPIQILAHTATSDFVIGIVIRTSSFHQNLHQLGTIQRIVGFKAAIGVAVHNTCFSKDSHFEGLLPADFYYCNTLTWKGETIFTMEHWTSITDFALYEDEKWLMLILQTGFYNPEYVYLVEL